jgi:hypothetical protein
MKKMNEKVNKCKQNIFNVYPDYVPTKFRDYKA